MIAPLALLLFWGGTYLLACAEYLTNPGVPLLLEYKTPSGVLKITADSYVLNTKTGDLTVTRPKISDPKGVVLLYADRIEAQGLPLLNNSARRAVVRVRKGYATLRRNPNGKFDFLEYLPKQEGPPSDFPFAVDLDRAQIKYVDESPSNRFVQLIDIKNVQVDGVGDKWIASTEANLPGVGAFKASVQQVPKEGLWVKGDTGKLELAKLYRAFRETPEGRDTPILKEFDAESLTVRGPFELLIPTDKNARILTRLVAEAKGFRYGKDYRADTARFEGEINAEGASGEIIAANPGLQANYKGFVAWHEGTRLSGNLAVRAQSLAALPRPLRTAIPKDVSVSGPIVYDGILAYTPDKGPRLSGQGSASNVTAFGESIQGPKVDLEYSDRRLAVVNRAGRWRGSNVQGALAFDERGQRIQGNLAASQVDLTGLATRAGIERLTGRGDLRVAVDGPLKNPTAFFRVDTQSTYAVRDDLPSIEGRLRLAGTLANQRVQIDQAYLVSKAGSLSATGSYDLNTQAIKLNAVGSGIDLFRIDPQLDGIGRFKASIEGTPKDPRYKGTAELFGLTVQDQVVPIITTDFTGNFKQVTAENIKAIKGVSQAEGRVALTFKNMGLDGSIQALGVQLSDFLGDDYLASISLPDATLKGTLSNPIFSSSAHAEDIVIQGSKIDSAKAEVTFHNGILQVDDFLAKAGYGNVDGYLVYDVNKKAGQANFEAHQIAISDFIPSDLGASIRGLFSGEAGLTFDAKGLKLGSGEGLLTDMVVNDTPFGKGVWSVSGNGQKLNGSLQVGLLERSFELNEFSYVPETKQIGGEVVVRNAQLVDLYNLSKPYLSNISPQIKELIERSEASIGAATNLGGTIENPNLEDGTFTFDKMKIGERAMGTLGATFSRENKLWTVNDLLWQDGPGLFKFSGTALESGPIAITGSVNNLDVNYLSAVFPEMANLQGLISLPLIDVSGETKSPVIRASAATVPDKGLYSGTTDPGAANKLNFNLSEIEISESRRNQGGINVEGDLNYGGYASKLTASIPFAYPFTIPERRQITAELQVVNRPIGSIEQLASVFDGNASKGDVGGKILLNGTKNNLSLTGNVGLQAEKLVLRNGSAKFSNVGLQAILDRGDERGTGAFRLTTQGTSDAGGSFSGDIQSQLPPVMDLLTRLAKGQTESLMNVELLGQFKADTLAAQFPIGKDGKAGGTLDGTLKIGGNIAEPTISGPLTISKGLIKMPSEIEEGTAKPFPTYSPRLDVQVALNGPAKFTSSAADIDLIGQGSIRGTLQDLDANALLRVRQGLFKLPTARVTLEPGGTIRPLFQTREGVSEARLDVELEGHTRVVTATFGQSAQRYDVNLGIRGDLLKDGGLTLAATSDPPDLSQDRILALLGQVNLIEGIASGVQSGNAESQLREAFFGVAVPYLLDPITSRIANFVGLDYLTLDINALEGTTVYFARTLSREFVIQGSRQVSQVNVNLPIKYDLRLTYQLRLGRRGDRRRLSFSVGTDEIRPWKLGVEFGFRF